MISVLILTRNEQRDLPDCLSSVSWSDDIHVFDSHSTDDTIKIAQAAGAHTHTRTFDDYATHRNAALTTVPFKHSWVFLLDADERPTPELSREMQQLALAAPIRPRPSAFDAATSSSTPGSNTPRSHPSTSASSAPAAPDTPARSTKSSRSTGP